jgi:hypothetical protein
MAPLMDATATTDELAPLTTRLRSLVGHALFDLTALGRNP